MRLRATVVVLALISSVAAVLPAEWSGRVVDGAGEPVAGATVWLCVDPDLSHPYDIEILDSAESQQDGSFALEDSERDRLTGGEWWSVFAHAEGYALGLRTPRSPGNFGEIRLDPPHTVSRRILGPEGEPLAGLTVTISSLFFVYPGTEYMDYSSVPPEVGQRVAVRTDPDGKFQLRATSPNTDPTLQVSTQHCGDILLVLQDPLMFGYGSAAHQLSSVTIPQPGRIEGRLVCDDRPELVSGRRIIARPHAHESPVWGWRDTETDPEGSFSLDPLPPGDYYLELSEQLAPTHHVRNLRSVLVGSGETSTAEMKAERTALVRGRVVAADTQEGIEGAEVSFGDQCYGSTAKTGPDGRYKLSCLPGEYMIEALSEGFVHLEPSRRMAPLTVLVEPDGTDAPDIALERTFTVTFRVVDGHGDPVSSAYVNAGRGFADYASGLTRSDGIFEARALLRGRTEVWAQKDNMALEAPVSVEVGENMEQVELVLQEGVLASVVGRVIDQEGAPVAGAELTLWITRPDWSGSRVRGAATAEDGRVQLAGLRSDLSYRLDIQAAGCDATASPQWTARAGQTHDLGDIVITCHRAFLAGIVVDEVGEPLPGVTVFNERDAPDPISTTTDEQGRFRLQGFREGVRYAFAYSPGRRLAAERASTGTEDLRITLHPDQPYAMGDPMLPERRLPLDEARELAKRLLVPAWIGSQGFDKSERVPILQWLALVDLETAKLAAATERGLTAEVYLAAGSARLADDFDEAMTLIRRVGDRSRAAGQLATAATDLKERDPALALRCARAAWDMAKEAEGAAFSPVDYPTLCGVLAELDPDQGQTILEQLRHAALQLDTDSDEGARARAAAALAVAVLFPDRAQELIRPIVDDIRAWEPPSEAIQPGEMPPMPRAGPSPGEQVMAVAARIAPQDPDGALELLQAFPDPWLPHPEVNEVFRAIAKVDPETALDAAYRTNVYTESVLPEVLSQFPADKLGRVCELAEAIADFRFRAAALARLCFVAPRERVPALIDAAMNMHDRPHPAGAAGGPHLDAQTLAQLACVARRLGYERHQEIALWAAARQGAPMPVGLPGASTFAELDLARILAFAAPELARGLIESFVTDHGGIGSIDAYFYELLAAAAAEVDVRWAASLIDQMPPDQPRLGRPYRALAVLWVCDVLLGDPDGRERALLREWLPGDDDT